MIVFDEKKRQINIEKHGFDFVDAQVIFDGFHITREDDSESYGEQRFRTLGFYHNFVVVMVVHTTEDDADRIISIRKADKSEEKFYWKQVAHYG